MGEVKTAWRFRCYLSERAEDQIDRWIRKTLSKKAIAKLERALEYLCVREKTEWSRPHASPLGHNIYVIRFADENSRQLRIAGHFHGETKFFVLTQPVIEKDNQYDPDNYAELASVHKNICDEEFNVRTQDCFQLDIHRDEDERGAAERAPAPRGWYH